MVAAPTPPLRGFNCSNCGGAVELRALQHTRAVVCTTCGALLDPRDPNVHVLQTAALKQSIAPAIPLGTRGTWHGHTFEVIGFQRRSIEVDGTRYSWDEYVLFNPYQGFRYLSEYQGHWNDIRSVRELPTALSSGARAKVGYRDDTYAHFQTATARTDFVLGEFPWRVRIDDPVTTSDYISPPLMLSSEHTDEETTWSLGTYTDGAQIWQAFSLPGEPPEPVGVFANQPSPHRRRAVRTFGVFAMLAAALLLLLLVRLMTADREQVFSAGYTYQPGNPDAAFVTEPFALRDESTVEIALITDLRNAWLGFDLALINVEAGTAWNVEREVSYYFGSDSDGAWSEGNQRNRLLLPAVPAGEYYLRVEPEGPPGGPSVAYSIHVRRDVPSLWPYAIAFLVLLVSPIVTLIRLLSFEHRRMQESDHSE